MTEQRKSKRGWIARWRERRRAKRQEAIEREYFKRERARASGSVYSTHSAYQHNALAASWIGFGGDGGGCGGGNGGGC